MTGHVKNTPYRHSERSEESLIFELFITEFFLVSYQSVHILADPWSASHDENYAFLVRKESRKSWVCLQRDNLERDQSIFYQRQGTQHFFCFGRVFAFKDQYRFISVCTEIHLTDDPGLVEFPGAGRFCFQMRFKLIVRRILDVFLDGQNFHGWFGYDEVNFGLLH